MSSRYRRHTIPPLETSVIIETQSIIKSFVYSYVSYRECEKITFLREWGDIVRSYGKVTDLFGYTLPNRNLYI